jgi:DNA-directed RNA polymerase subunit F
MIKESRPVSMTEVVKLVGDSKKAEEIKRFVKNFDVLKVEKAEELAKEIEALDLIKLKDIHVVKIVDFVPTDAEELNKVLVDVSLDADEVNKILDVTKKYR